MVSPTTRDEQLHHENLRLSQIEYQLQHIHLRSRPRCLGLVLSNRCNIGCVHCYQSKNGDNLLSPASIGQELRRELMGLYPYLSTLRLQGGELFAIAGFQELLDDVAATTSRPIVSISTNATLIDEAWAERIVRTPFQNVTISIDAARPETYARLRRGARLETVLANTRRLQKWKDQTGSAFPQLDSFFVVMRSNFREIPEFLRIAKDHGITSVCFQTVKINAENSSRFPMLERDEAIDSAAEIAEFHAVMREAMAEHRRSFQILRFSGLTSLFERQGLDASFLNEENDGLYPDSEGLKDGAGQSPAFDLCPNPWTTLFIVENGDVHLCFLSEAVGNIYQDPIEHIWNSPQALIKRSRMAAGRYLESGCSSQWCSWREGSRAAPPAAGTRQALLAEMKGLLASATQSQLSEPLGNELAPVRRMLAARDRRIAELEAMFVQLCETNQQMHEQGQAYIDDLERRLALQNEQLRAREEPLVRIALGLSRKLGQMR